MYGHHNYNANSQQNPSKTYWLSGTVTGLGTFRRDAATSRTACEQLAWELMRKAEAMQVNAGKGSLVR